MLYENACTVSVKRYSGKIKKRLTLLTSVLSYDENVSDKCEIYIYQLDDEEPDLKLHISRWKGDKKQKQK